MSFSDVLKKSFLQGVNANELTMGSIAGVICLAGLIGLYIFAVYYLTGKKAFYSRSFNISLVALTMITAGIILTIQTSVVISLGMVGALSIVRFRTAVKDPMDLIYLLWSISVGIICGAGLIKVAVVVSLLVTVAIMVLELLPVLHTPMILIVNAQSDNIDDKLKDIISGYSKNYKVKSRNLTQSGLDLIIELKVKDDGADLVRRIKEIEGVYAVSLVLHDGEAAY